MRRMIIGLLAVTMSAGTALAQSAASDKAKPDEAASVAKSWTDHISVKGDVRLRYETVDDDSRHTEAGEHYTRDRARIRARLSGEAKIEELKVGLGLSTGGEDPVSGNVTLGEGFSKEDFRLDLAYMEYGFFKDSPYELKLLGGKMKNPLITVSDDLIWDSDLNPEGIAANATYENDLVTVYVNGEGLWIDERETQNNAYGLAGQAAVKFKLMSDVGLTIGGTICAFQNIKGYDVIDWEDKNKSYGNSTIPGSVSGSTTNKAFAEDFTPIVGFAKCDLPLRIPVSVSAQVLTNPEADDDNMGYSAGIALGKAKKPNSFEVGYSWARLEKDATLGMFTDSDRWGGGTDGEDHKFYGKYQIAKNLQAGATFHLGEKKISGSDGGTDYNRLQLDISANF